MKEHVFPLYSLATHVWVSEAGFAVGCSCPGLESERDMDLKRLVTLRDYAQWGGVEEVLVYWLPWEQKQWHQ